MGSFMKQNSKISISLVYQDGEEVFKALSRGDLDVAILPDVKSEYGQQASQYESRPLFKDEMWLVASGRDASVPDEITVEELASRPFMRLTERYLGFEKILNAAVDRAGLKITPSFETNNVGTLKRVIESGLGWGFLPSHSIRKQVRMGRLTTVDCEPLRHAVNVNYYSRSSAATEQSIDVFFRALKQQGIG
jgi:DNA-binding transcriptional LysR family regulator